MSEAPQRKKKKPRGGSGAFPVKQKNLEVVCCGDNPLPSGSFHGVIGVSGGDRDRRFRAYCMPTVLRVSVGKSRAGWTDHPVCTLCS
jgi:hypothetical protein